MNCPAYMDNKDITISELVEYIQGRLSNRWTILGLTGLEQLMKPVMVLSHSCNSLVKHTKQTTNYVTEYRISK